nr:hypothetical protein CFP56_02645 [Quercus suber]
MAVGKSYCVFLQVPFATWHEITMGCDDSATIGVGRCSPVCHVCQTVERLDFHDHPCTSCCRLGSKPTESKASTFDVALLPCQISGSTEHNHTYEDIGCVGIRSRRHTGSNEVGGGRQLCTSLASRG